MHLTQQFTTIYLQQPISYNNFKAPCLEQSGVHLIVTVTTATLITKSVVLDATPLLPTKLLSSNSILFYNAYLQQVLKIVVATVAKMVVLVVSHMGFCLISSFRFAGFISTSGNCCPLNHKGTKSPSIFLVHPDVQRSICVSQCSMQCLYWQHRRFLLLMYFFALSGSGRIF